MNIVGQGRCALLTAIDDTKILKLYEPRFTAERVNAFAKCCRQVHAAGVRAPEVFSVEDHDGQTGMVLERIYGVTLWEAIRNAPERAAQFGADLADLHLEIHESTVPGLEEKLTEVASRVVLRDDQNLVNRAIAILDDGRQGRQVLLHGDLHPANVMVDEDGQLISFDWDGAMVGPAAYDVARAYFLISTWALAPGTDELDARVRQEVADAYVARYSARAGDDVGPIEPWFLPVVLARYAENVTEEYPMLDDQTRDALAAFD